MPWSARLVIIVYGATLIPGYGEYVAFLVVFAGAMIAGSSLILFGPLEPLVQSIGAATGLNRMYLLGGLLPALVVVLGVFFLVRAIRSDGERGLNAAIVLLGLIAVDSGYRVARLWPT